MKYFLLACGIMLIITAFAISKQKTETTPLREATSVSTSAPASSTQLIDLPLFFLACQQGKTKLIKEFLRQNKSIDVMDKMDIPV